MGQKATALFVHTLTPAEIIELPKVFATDDRSPWRVLPKLEHWKWSCGDPCSTDLLSIWSQQWPPRHKWSDADLAILQGPGLAWIHFLNPTFATYSDTLSWEKWKEDQPEKTAFMQRCLFLGEILRCPEFPVVGETIMVDDLAATSSGHALVRQLAQARIEHSVLPRQAHP